MISSRAGRRPKTTRLLRDAAGDHLEDGEAIEVGLRVLRKTLASNTGVAGSRAVPGALGSLAANRAHARIDEERDRAEATGLPTAPAMGYGLTDRRIVVWPLDKWTHEPEAVIGDIPLTDLTGRDATAPPSSCASRPRPDRRRAR